MTELEKQETVGEWELNHALHFFLLLDNSGSMMNEGKMKVLNDTIRESFHTLKPLQKKHIKANIYIRAVTFSDGARWHIANPTLLEEFQWQEVVPGGLTDMGEAFDLIAQELQKETMKNFLFPPVLLLFSDGQPTDDWEKGLTKVINTPMGSNSIRIAVGIGRDSDLGVLQKFVDDGVGFLVKANNVGATVASIEESLKAGLLYASLNKGTKRSMKPYNSIYSCSDHNPVSIKEKKCLPRRKRCQI